MLPVVAHGPSMPEDSLASVPSVAVAVKLVKSTTALPRVKVPATLRVRPAAAFQLCLPCKASPQLRVRFCVAVLRSMPDAPTVRVLPAPRVTKPPGLTILIPAQARSAPNNVLLAAVTVDVHWAMSAGPGAVVSQLAGRLRSVVLLALLSVAAGADEGTKASHAAMAPARMTTLLQAPMPGWLGFFMGVVWRMVGRILRTAWVAPENRTLQRQDNEFLSRWMGMAVGNRLQCAKGREC